MPWRVALLAPLVVVVAAVASFAGFVTEDRDVLVATPQPAARFEISPVALEPGATACAAPVPVTADGDLLRLRGLRISGAPAAPLRVTVTAPGGYRASRAFSRYADFETLDVALPDPPRALEGRVCVRNEGADRALLEGSRDERAEGTAATEIGGRPAETDLAITIRADGRESLADRADDVARAAATSSPASPGVLWGLGVLALVGVPLGLAFALRRAGQP